MKVCTKCGDTKPLEDFVKNKRRSDGRHSWCRICHRGAVKRSLKRWRRAHLSTYLSNFFGERYKMLRLLKSRPCMDCAGSFPWYVMDFDHRDPTTKASNVSLMVGQSIAWERVLEEAAKCDLVCACCHRLRTHTVKQGQKLKKVRVLIREAKQDPCLDCGQSFKPCQMDFDHVRGEKAGFVSQIGSVKAVLAEIQKCEVVCANCHRIRTQTRNLAEAS